MHKFSYLIFQMEYEKKCCSNYSPRVPIVSNSISSPFSSPLESCSKLVVLPRVRNLHNLESSTNHRLKENVPQTHTVFQKLAHTKRARAASRSIREISSASGSTYAPLLPDFDVWSMPGNGWGLLLLRVPTPASSNPGKGGKEGLRRRRRVVSHLC